MGRTLGGGVDHVAVGKSAKAHVVAGKRAYGSGWYTFSLAQILTGVLAATQMKIVTYGDAVFVMSSTIIGSLIGKVAISNVLGEAEYDWKSDASRKRKIFGDNITGDMVAIKRYVDDLLVISRSLCAGCSERYIQAIYPIPFGVTGSGNNLIWLDSVVCFDSQENFWTVPKNVNRAWVHGCGTKKRHTLLPYLGALPYRFSSIRAILVGRVHRCKQQLVSDSLCALRVLEDMYEMLCAKYETNFLRKCVHALPQRFAAARIAQRVWRLFAGFQKAAMVANSGGNGGNGGSGGQKHSHASGGVGSGSRHGSHQRSRRRRSSSTSSSSGKERRRERREKRWRRIREKSFCYRQYLLEKKEKEEELVTINKGRRSRRRFVRVSDSFHPHSVRRR